MLFENVVGEQTPRAVTSIDGDGAEQVRAEGALRDQVNEIVRHARRSPRRRSIVVLVVVVVIITQKVVGSTHRIALDGATAAATAVVARVRPVVVAIPLCRLFVSKNK